MMYWAACDCYVWPLASLQGTGRCGLCGTRPDVPMDEPVEGKARPLRDTEKRLLAEYRARVDSS